MNLNTKDYRIRIIFQERDSRKLPGFWPVGLDIGYSAVKVFSGNAVVCFPSYAAISQGEALALPTGNGAGQSILYRGEDGVVWEAGAAAQDRISVSDTSAGSLSIYGRSRYYSPMFLVLARIGIAAGIRKNAFGDPGTKKLKIQTGLPPKYIVTDREDLVSVLCGEHRFEVKFGNGSWEKFFFSLDEEDISVIDQPQGTLFSIAADPSLKLMPGAAQLFSSRLLVIDPGFGTMDMFPMIKRTVSRDQCQTFPELGMKQVLKDTADEILKRCRFEIPVPAMQRFLDTGKVLVKNGRTYSQMEFADILEKHSKDICNKAVEKIMEIYNPPVEFDYLVLTAGTGEAWKEYFFNHPCFKDSGTVQVLPGNYGDPTLPWLFSNARGYFVYALSRAAAG